MIVEHRTFDCMKAHAEFSAPAGRLALGGRSRHLHQPGRQRPLDRPADGRYIAAYEACARAELGEACAHWLATGELSG